MVVEQRLAGPAMEASVTGPATELAIDITVHNLPPGTSKWNKIEHRLYSHTTLNWRGKPVVSYQTIISLIGDTGLTVRCEQDDAVYQKCAKVIHAEMAEITSMATNSMENGLHHQGGGPPRTSGYSLTGP